MNKTTRSRIKAVLAVAGIAGLIGFLRYCKVDFSDITFETFKTRILAMGPWGPVAYIVLYIFRPVILLPASITSAAAGVIFGVGPGFCYLQIAANLSAAGEFFFARYFARDAVANLIKGRAEKIDAAIERRGFLTVLLIRLIPNAPWDIQNLSLGLTRVKFRDYMPATIIGIMPASFALVFFGSSFISAITDLKNLWKIGLAVLIFATVIWLQKFLRRKKSGAAAVTSSVTTPVTETR